MIQSPDDYLFSYDVMLAEYVIDPSEGSYAPERIKLKYLGATGDSLNAAELYRLVAVDARGDTRARSGEAAVLR